MANPTPVLTFTDRSNSAVRDAELFCQSQVGERVALSPFGLRVRQRQQAFYFADFIGAQFLRTPNRAVVFANMDSLRRKYLQILRSIVVTVLVFVMNDFAWSQRPSDLLFSHKQATFDVIANGSRMFGGENQHVPLLANFSTIPTVSVLSSRLKPDCVAVYKSMPLATRELRNRLATSAGAKGLRRNLTPFRHA